jgi:hypothetical protein
MAKIYWKFLLFFTKGFLRRRSLRKQGTIGPPGMPVNAGAEGFRTEKD